MIPRQELLRLRGEWQLDVGVIEKDYVLGWVLAAIAAEPALAGGWVFKGGTCLRKCYYETYRRAAAHLPRSPDRRRAAHRPAVRAAVRRCVLSRRAGGESV